MFLLLLALCLGTHTAPPRVDTLRPKFATHQPSSPSTHGLSKARLNGRRTRDGAPCFNPVPFDVFPACFAAQCFLLRSFFFCMERPPPVRVVSRSAAVKGLPVVGRGAKSGRHQDQRWKLVGKSLALAEAPALPAWTLVCSPHPRVPNRAS